MNSVRSRVRIACPVSDSMQMSAMYPVILFVSLLESAAPNMLLRTIYLCAPLIFLCMTKLPVLAEPREDGRQQEHQMQIANRRLVRIGVELGG